MDRLDRRQEAADLAWSALTMGKLRIKQSDARRWIEAALSHAPPEVTDEAFIKLVWREREKAEVDHKEWKVGVSEAAVSYPPEETELLSVEEGMSQKSDIDLVADIALSQTEPKWTIPISVTIRVRITELTWRKAIVVLALIGDSMLVALAIAAWVPTLLAPAIESGPLRIWGLISVWLYYHGEVSVPLLLCLTVCGLWRPYRERALQLAGRILAPISAVTLVAITILIAYSIVDTIRR